MSDEPSFLNRLRRPAREPIRPDYSEPDFPSWATKMEAFVEQNGPTWGAAAKAGDTDTTGPPQSNTTNTTNTSNTSNTTNTIEKPSSLNLILENMLDFEGAMCAALADSESGMVLGHAGSGIDMDRAAASASMILRARRATVRALAIPDQIDDILVTLTTQLHIIRPLVKTPTIFIYVVADRSKASLAMGRYKANEAEAKIEL